MDILWQRLRRDQRAVESEDTGNFAGDRGFVVSFPGRMAGVRTRSVLAAQEPDLRQQPSDKDKEVPSTSKRPKRDAHVSLGLGRVPDAAAAKRGEPLFQANCQACHGAQARGGQAPSLVRSVLVLHDDDDVEIPQIIKNGRGNACVYQPDRCRAA